MVRALRHHTRSTLLISVVALLALLALAASCGGDDNKTTTTASPSPAATATPGHGPGTITLTSTSIRGQSGKVLLISATSPGGGPRIARLCRGIDSDAFTLSGGTLTDVPGGDDPCGGSTPETKFGEGTYQVTAGVYVGGQQSPEKQTTLSVTVAGDVTAQLDGAALSK